MLVSVCMYECVSLGVGRACVFILCLCAYVHWRSVHGHKLFCPQHVCRGPVSGSGPEGSGVELDPRSRASLGPPGSTTPSAPRFLPECRAQPGEEGARERHGESARLLYGNFIVFPHPGHFAIHSLSSIHSSFISFYFFLLWLIS